MKRKGIKNAKNKLEEKFEKIYRASPDIIILTRFEDGKIADVSDAFEKIIGYSPKEFIGKTSLELYVNPEDRNKILKILRENGRARNFETIFKTKSGDKVNILINSELMEIDGELYIVSVLRDITELKRTEEELKRTIEVLSFINRILFNCSSSIILEEILQNVLKETLDITGLEGGTVCLLNEGNTLTLSAHIGTSEEVVRDLTTNKIKVGDCLCGKCAEDGKPLILRNREEVLSFATRESTRGEKINFHAAFL